MLNSILPTILFFDHATYARACHQALCGASPNEFTALGLIAAIGCIGAYFILHWLRKRLWADWRRVYVVCLYFVPPLCVLLLFALSVAILGEWPSTALLSIVSLGTSLLFTMQIPAVALELVFRPVRPLRLSLRCLTVLLAASGFFALSQPERDINEVVAAARALDIDIGFFRLNLASLAEGVATGVVVVVIAHGTVNWLGARLRSSMHLPPNFSLAIRRILDITVWTIAATIVLQRAGIDVKAIATFVGALGIGLGLGLQRLAASYVSGLIVLFEQSVRVGDVISAGGIKGRVTQMTVRYTTLMGADGVEALVPNDALTLNTVLNQSWSDDNLRLSSSVHIDIASDVAMAKQIVVGVLREQARVLAEPQPAVYVADIADGRIRLEAQFWVADPANGQLNLISDINEVVLRSFGEHRIRLAPPLPRLAT
ncbi:mechanosensitive ion channel protein [Caballeronia hypogeia]|uniref:Mechanosensitive ion channel protein n=1 Tax=Caballeronia hypogeia TaxID=1777140 RepID=A0A157ZXG3_9BURK|nr:mechanosensitive ion channel domain-containing protein [Caballeronia hypogeia]SAK50179.1 mechanosensitive ion channel protein [Caballeronia hypogeia]